MVITCDKDKCGEMLFWDTDNLKDIIFDDDGRAQSIIKGKYVIGVFKVSLFKKYFFDHKDNPIPLLRKGSKTIVKYFRLIK